MNTTDTFLIACTFLLWGMLPEQQAPMAHRLTVEIEPVEYKKGILHLAIYDSEESFPDAAEPYRKQKVKVDPTQPLSITIEALPPGRYALAIYLDENENDELDKNMLGIPKEPYGFSNNPRAKWSAPRFDEIAFEMNAAATKLAIDLKKWKHR